MRYILICIVLLIKGFYLFSQENSKIIFSSPLGIPLNVTGNFAELRNNHFHAGIDFSTKAQEGYRVYSIADGTITRIKVSPYGYGKAIYIDHPNGYTSVYAHLISFGDSLDRIIKDIQYKNREFSIDSVFSPGFTVKKGQVIGLSGNTGTSYGPHLHFEIRETETEFPVNPQLFEFGIQDTIKPVPHKIFFYPLESNSTVNGKNERISFSLEKKDRKFIIKKDRKNPVDEIIVSGKTGIGITVSDFYTDKSNSSGIYRIRMLLDSVFVYGFTMKQFSFDDTRYLNSHIDYAENVKSGTRIHKLFREPGNRLNIYDNKMTNGVLDFDQAGNHKLDILIEDINGNFSVVNVDLTAKTPVGQIIERSCEKVIPSGSKEIFEKDGIRVVFFPESLYDTLRLEYTLSSGAKFLSPVYKIHNRYTAIHKAIEVSIHLDKKHHDLYDKLVVVRYNNEKSPVSIGGSVKSHTITAKSLNFGYFSVMADTIAPVIKPLNIFEGAKFVKDNKIEIKITDNLSGIRSFTGTIDGKWVLFEYLPAKEKIIYNFDANLLKTGNKHELLLQVFDERLNRAEYKVSFYY
ncbi:MAG: hypothetical protein A2W91_03350 [Bacteroidetes bacterium GWF2_38_335]|nr:MAG: hypothetical protein A2W91_03350 [Bacteroidetes bacterium GWF2_38_335]OFY77478.1 MAG: hypothetical protein A2281_01410 [Bacteroidetes bacterium RIFOXYA12_FULL_38_20]HBS87230.1 hypothetical protein [Bacteroidales bacterium]